MSASLIASPELRRLALLREFKLRRLKAGGENHSPFADRVATTHGDESRVDLSELHCEVRDSIVQQIASVHANHRSQVVLLSGDAGAGKTHVLRHFAQPEVAEDHGYVFIGGSNDWSVDEFQPCLLDWMLSALTSPSPSEDHPLLERVRAIGFRALGQLLENRTALKRCIAKGRRRFFGLLRGRRESYETIETLTRNRDPEVFNLLNFTHFTEEVCTRFLAEPGNPVHRYALRVLLTYLFPDPVQTGVGTRDRVLNWFRRKSDDGYWTRRLGVSDDLTKRYELADAIKLLIHLFSPDLSKRLSVDGDECEPKVFLFVFDQAEGRDELFETLEDWNQFFARLSELYNTLPNVLVLFTMTLRLRNELHPKMERQFRERIRQDQRFVLGQPTDKQIQALYRARLAGWIADDPVQRELYNALPVSEQHLPFSAEQIAEIGGTKSARAALAAFDPAFEEALRNLVIEPWYDFEFVLNEQREPIERLGDYDYTADHLETVRKLIEPLAEELAAVHDGVRLTAVVEEPVEKLRVLRLDFVDPAVPSSWVCVYLTRFSTQYKAQIPKCENLLFRRQTARYSVWMVRPKPFSPDFTKPDQMLARLAPIETEARLRAARHLLDKRADYEKNETWAAAWKLIRDEIGQSYLGEVLVHARDRVKAIKAGGVPEETVIS